MAAAPNDIEDLKHWAPAREMFDQCAKGPKFLAKIEEPEPEEEESKTPVLAELF